MRFLLSPQLHGLGGRSSLSPRDQKSSHYLTFTVQPGAQGLGLPLCFPGAEFPKPRCLQKPPGQGPGMLTRVDWGSCCMDHCRIPRLLLKCTRPTASGIPPGASFLNATRAMDIGTNTAHQQNPPCTLVEKTNSMRKQGIQKCKFPNSQASLSAWQVPSQVGLHCESLSWGRESLA